MSLQKNIMQYNILIKSSIQQAEQVDCPVIIQNQKKKNILYVVNTFFLNGMLTRFTFTEPYMIYNPLFLGLVPRVAITLDGR